MTTAESLSTVALSLLTGGLLTGVGTWVAFSGRVVTFSKLATQLEPIRSEIQGMRKDIQTALRSTDQIVPLERIQSIAQKESPWLHDKESVNRRIDALESSVNRTADLFVSVSSRLTRIETNIDRLLNGYSKRGNHESEDRQ